MITDKFLLEIDDLNFQGLVLDNKGTVMVDFYANWCQPCRVMGTEFKDLAESYAGQVTFGKVDVDENARLTFEYGIRSIPTVLVFHNGELVNRLDGYQTRSTLAMAIDAARNQTAN